MAQLKPMPPVILDPAKVLAHSKDWDAKKVELAKASGEKIGKLCDQSVSTSLAQMLGGIKVCPPKSATALLPPFPECVEVGPTRVIGGIRPQNFDVVYRPDGIRFAYDTKTLNTKSSVAKNYQNMINDLGTEAATVHTRFPSAVVAFLFAVPLPCLGNHRAGLLGALSRLGGRLTTNADLHKAEAIAIAAYDPLTGQVDDTWPDLTIARLRLDHFHQQVETSYIERFAGLPPHR